MPEQMQDSLFQEDIDIAARGIEPEIFFAVYGQLLFRLHHRVDDELISSGELKRVA